MTGNTSGSRRRAHCLCGSVRLVANAASDSVCACHCEGCRRWSGAPLMEIECGPDVTISGEQYVTVFESSQWAERAFCSRCGSHLFYRLKDTMNHMVPVGLFEDQDGLRFAKQVFVDERPDYYAFSNETNNLTGKQCLAAFADHPA